ncbi:MAG: indolepyruvate ferredoxin oxidoreductase subunit alpha [Planctomycetaceae bacterium]|jgi:indolepyruvate ferredoxin oxidoreductase alpha subunit|nr:indolepyruvate ferredoxin oxidoreductase subunit alpha [Planctomycetaceae bacterium]
MSDNLEKTTKPILEQLPAISLLSGNEAIARGAYESGVTFAAGYPGTPSTEILEAIAAEYSDKIYAEWSPNEKVAFEAAAGASFAGGRSITTMKHVGLNVAADPLMTLSYIGGVGGFVAVVADDPGMHSSQNEQDTRRYAQFAKIPIFEPADSNEAKEYTKLAIQLSEKCTTPVILRTTTRVSHSRSLVKLEEREESGREINFEKDPPRFVPIPLWGRQMRHRLESRLVQILEELTSLKVNKIEIRDTKIGIITSGISYQYVREVFPNASTLKLGVSFPFADDLIREFSRQVERLVVIEELEDFLEEHIKALGISCAGKNVMPRIGEFSPDLLFDLRDAIVGDKVKESDVAKSSNKPEETTAAAKSSGLELPKLPSRPPVLCPGCPHRGIFYALGRFDVVVTGDIGCYSLGVFPPLSRLDTILCMGGGVSLAHGMAKSDNKRKVVGIVGDSTFFHSGITGLLDIAYNKSDATIIVLDNRITAMTGHQDNPGSGKTLMGEDTISASIEDIGRACGINNITTVNPREVAKVVAAIDTAIKSNEPQLIVSKAPCPLHLRKMLGEPLEVDESLCRKCGICLKLGCPGLEKQDGNIRINKLLCAGCEMCKNICPAKAITRKEIK